ncbi:MAG: glycosyltransferase [Gammaproteobacteria bacterium]|nr:glycosyltransferase [Gammaproteobacteria bacterium]MBU2181056.1 glycosyltransferase [Gammaproteobacteria bacterium]MBU2225786.1 glycosyltransferase [Gammaproteobacteria bacterium]
MSKAPFISIVLPTRDRPELVKQCLLCIKNQEFADFEVIISDNPLSKSCEAIVAPYLSDKRFRYYKTDKPLAMPDNWEFAVTFATGDYIAVINEKFMFRPDAFSVIKKIADQNQPDILTWQFDHFELTDYDSVLGDYHPLLKPVNPEYYAAADELKRRLDFIEPLYSRYVLEKNDRGKIYSGCVKRQVVEKIKNIYGRMFMPLSPDFSSMICCLSQSDVCVDIGQSLMLLVRGKNISHGTNTKKSISTILEFLKEINSDFKQYSDSMVIPGFGVGHTVSIASDYQTIMNVSKQGCLSNITLNKAAVLGWAKLELEYVDDWAGYNKSDFLSVLELYGSRLSADDLATSEYIKEVCELHKQPCPREIYHSGLTKVDYFIEGISAERLAELHWIEHIALPRRGVSLEAMTISEAIDYFYKYNQVTSRMLGLN